MIVLTTNNPDTRSTAIDLTSTGAIAALTLLPEGRDDAIAAALSPGAARRLAGELADFAERHRA